MTDNGASSVTLGVSVFVLILIAGIAIFTIHQRDRKIAKIASIEKTDKPVVNVVHTFDPVVRYPYYYGNIPVNPLYGYYYGGGSHHGSHRSYGSHRHRR